jgi:hypothetical protein
LVERDPHGIGGFQLILQCFAFRGLSGLERECNLVVPG